MNNWLRLVLVGLALSLSGCGSDADRVANEPMAPEAPAPAGFGVLLVKVTDYFGQPAPGANITLNKPPLVVKTVTDAEGNARLDDVPAGSASLCVHDEVRGSSCDGITVPVDGTVSVERRLRLGTRDPVAAIVAASVPPDGLSADGQTLQVSLRFAVTGGTASWFNGGDYAPSVLDCVAREGQELAEYGPRCLTGPNGNDVSYTFGGLVRRPAQTSIAQPLQANTVGLLLDASEPLRDGEALGFDSRLFEAKLFADNVLPDAGIVLAGFAADDPAGDSSAQIPRTPVTAWPDPVQGVFVSKPEIFDQLDSIHELSGGVAPLYSAVLSFIDTLADNAIPGTRRVLVVMANGRDDVCETRAECRLLRDAVAARAAERNIELVLAGTLDADWDSAIWALAVEHSIPLIVGPGYLDERRAFELVEQLLGDSIPAVDVRLKLMSEEPGAFHSGAIVTGRFQGDNASACPFGCRLYTFPFSVTVP